MILAWPDDSCYCVLIALENTSKEKQTLRSPRIELGPLVSKIIFQNQWAIKSGHISPQKLVRLFLAKLYQIIKTKLYFSFCLPSWNLQSNRKHANNIWNTKLQQDITDLWNWVVFSPPMFLVSDNWNGKLRIS